MSSNLVTILTESSTGSTTSQDTLRYIADSHVFQCTSNIVSSTTPLSTIFASSNYQTKMMINSTGVGIGSYTPTVALDVAGSINSTGTLVTSSNITIPGNLSAGGIAIPNDTSNILKDLGAYNLPLLGMTTGTIPLVPGTQPFDAASAEPSLYFDGVAGNTFTTSAAMAQFVNAQWNTTGMTIEAWVNYPTFTGASAAGSGTPTATIRPRMLGAMTPTSTTMYWAFGVGTDAKVVFNYSPAAGEYTFTAQTTVLSVDTWYHIAFSCTTSGVVYMFINGVQQDIIANNNGTLAAAVPSSTVTGTPNATSPVFTIGQYNSARANFYLASPRIVIGQALYTTGFTPQTAPLTVASTGITSLLIRTSVSPGTYPLSKIGGTTVVRAYPPVAMDAITTDLTGRTSYGGGTYIATASSEYDTGSTTISYAASSRHAYFAFNKNFASTSTFWTCGPGRYVTGTGVLVPGFAQTVDFVGNVYAGEWLQIQLPVAIAISSYQIWPQGNGVATAPASFVVLASSDGQSWVPISSRTAQTWTQAVANTYTCVPPSSYSFYRLVVRAVVSDTIAIINEWVLYGTQESINITADGSIGIGVPFPKEQLEVAGNTVVGGYLDSAGGPISTVSAIPYTQFDGSARNRDLFLKWLTRATTPWRGNWWNNQTLRFSSTIATGSVGIAGGYSGGVLLPDGRVYCASFNSLSIGLFNPITNVFSTIASVIPAANSYIGAVLLPDGRVYCVPSYSITGGGLFNPATNVFTSSVTGTSPGNDEYRRGVLLPDGRVYCIQAANTGGGGIFTPSAAGGTFSTTATTGTTPGGYSYLGGILLPDGRVYCIPYNTITGGGIFNPRTNVFSSSIVTGASPGGGAYQGGVLLPDGRVYCVPRNTAGLGGGIFNPATNVFSSTITTGAASGATVYVGGVLLPDGRVYCIPCNSAGGGGIFNPATNVFTSTVTGTSPASGAYEGGVLLPDGRVYCVPSNTNSGGIFQTYMKPTYDQCYHPCFNGCSS